MTLAFGIAIYFIIWWTVLFAMLPIGVRTSEEAGEKITPGNAESAPHMPQSLAQDGGDDRGLHHHFRRALRDHRASRDHARSNSVLPALRSRAVGETASEGGTARTKKKQGRDDLASVTRTP